jgi:hypothetical protein
MRLCIELEDDEWKELVKLTKAKRFNRRIQGRKVGEKVRFVIKNYLEGNYNQQAPVATRPQSIFKEIPRTAEQVRREQERLKREAEGGESPKPKFNPVADQMALNNELREVWKKRNLLESLRDNPPPEPPRVDENG